MSRPKVGPAAAAKRVTDQAAADLLSGKHQAVVVDSPPGAGKSTFVVRNRNGFIPQAKLVAILPVLAQQAMTPPV